MLFPAELEKPSSYFLVENTLSYLCGDSEDRKSPSALNPNEKEILVSTSSSRDV
jgi:hypothetical protein